MQLRRPGRRTWAGAYVFMPMGMLVGFVGTAAVTAGEARADGELAVRGVYYKEKATRVVQPMLDARLDIAPDTELEVHTLVDAITSASVAAGAGGGDDDAEATGDPFTERRYEAGAALSRRMGDYLCGLSGRFSYEPDYRSVFGGARCQVELAQRNTTLGMALGMARDHLSDANARGEMNQDGLIEGELSAALVSASFTQVLSPTMLAGLTYDLTYMEGFLENPYREVTVGGGAGGWEPERLPESRLRHAIFGNVRSFVPRSSTTLIAGYRFYTDDWGIVGHTPEARVVQEIAPRIDVHARYRFHWQSAAEFYEPTYDTGDVLREPYITDDAKLSRFTSHTIGLELETALSYLDLGLGLGKDGLMRNARMDLVLEYVVQNNRFGNAIVAQTALIVPLSY